MLFQESIQRGAALKTIAERGRQVKVQFAHGRDSAVGGLPIAKLTSLEEDSFGLAYTATLFPGPHLEQLTAALASGQLGSSISFRSVQEDWDPRPGRSTTNRDGIPERRIREIALRELGPVVNPANPSATAGLRGSNLVVPSHPTKRRYAWQRLT